jgi:DNA-binding PadR family transcriptional regulator
VSSIRLFVLGALADEGEMHGHQLRQLAELEHIDQWTDITVGALYGALKRLSAEGLIEEARTEQVGGYPERVVWRITESGRVVLGDLRRSMLREIVIRPDPFDLAIARTDPAQRDDVAVALAERLESMRVLLAESERHTARITPYLSDLELLVIGHRTERIRADIAWHENLLEQLPRLLEDHHARMKEGHS